MHVSPTPNGILAGAERDGATAPVIVWPCGATFVVSWAVDPFFAFQPTSIIVVVVDPVPVHVRPSGNPTSRGPLSVILIWQHPCKRQLHPTAQAACADCPIQPRAGHVHLPRPLAV